MSDPYEIVLNKVYKPPELPKERFSRPREPIHVDDSFFIELATSSEFKRFVYKLLYGHVHRTEAKHGNLNQRVQEGITKARMDYQEVMKELKERLKERENKML